MTTNIRCNNSFKGDVVYWLNNIAQYFSILLKTPFSTGAFMCIKTSTFNTLHGFDSNILFAEDYWLSKQVKRTGIVKSNIYTSNRRFKKSGYWWMIKTFIKTYFNRNNYQYFTSDFNYWN